MKKRLICFAFLCCIAIVLSACLERGPYFVELQKPAEDIVRIDLVDARNEDQLFSKDTYADCVICSLNPTQATEFVEGLQTIEFYASRFFESSRHLGEIAAWIYYDDGSSDLIGSNFSYFFDPDLNIISISVSYPDKDAFYALFAKFVDPQLLPRK